MKLTSLRAGIALPFGYAAYVISQLVIGELIWI